MDIYYYSLETSVITFFFLFFFFPDIYLFKPPVSICGQIKSDFFLKVTCRVKLVAKSRWLRQAAACEAWASSKQNRTPLRCETYGSTTWVWNRFKSVSFQRWPFVSRYILCCCLVGSMQCHQLVAGDGALPRIIQAAKISPCRTLPFLRKRYWWVFMMACLIFCVARADFNRGGTSFNHTWNNNLFRPQFWVKPFTWWTNWDSKQL